MKSTAIRIFIFMTLVTGVFYPVVITVLGAVLFPRQASGDFIERGGHVIGANLIAQKFVDAKYFWGRPSSIDYNPLPSGASNLGPTSQALKKAVEDRVSQVHQAHGLSEDAPIPQDLLFASGSGLDPEISPEAALFQVGRVANARAFSAQDRDVLEQLVHTHIQWPQWGWIGEARVNVLQLNMALDEMAAGRK